MSRKGDVGGGRPAHQKKGYWNGGKKDKIEDGEDDDEGSSVAKIDFESDDDDAVARFSEEVSKQILNLSEKRGETRVTALKTLGTLLSARVCTEILEPNAESSLDAVLKCLKRGSYDEKLLALRVASLIFLNLGGEHQASYDFVAPQLTALVMDTAADRAVVGAAINTLALACFVATVESDPMKKNMELCHKMFETERCGASCVAAIKAWGLLATSLPLREMVDDLFLACLELFEPFLMEGDLEVRQAAGVNIALLFDASKQLAEEDETFEDMVQNVDTESLVDTIENIASDSSRYVSKETRKEQRSFFRDILKTVKDRDSPDDSIVVGKAGETVHFTTWTDILRAEAIRDVLQGGTQVHFAKNDLLREIFDSREAKASRAGLSGAERRAVMSPNSAGAKLQTQNMAHKRAMKRAAHAGDDGDDAPFAE